MATPLTPTSPSTSAPVAPAPPPRSASVAGRTTVMVIVFVLVARLMGIVRSIVVAQVFGQNATTDIYNRAFAVPDMMQLLLAGGALSTVFQPLFIDYLKNKGEKEGWQLLGRVATLITLAAIFVIILAEIFAYPLSRFAALSFSKQAAREMVPLVRVLLPAQLFFFVGGLFIATLQARDKWLVPNLAPLVYPLGIIGGALLFGEKYGPVALTVGAVIGAGLGNFLLPLLAVLHSGGRFAPSLDFKHEGVRRFLELMAPAMLGLGLSQLAFLLTGFFLGEGGALTALKNGYELTQAPIGIFAQASAIALFPTLSRLAAGKEWPAFTREIHHGIRRILFLTIPASVLLAVLAEPIITALYYSPKLGPDGLPRFGVPQIHDAAIALRLYSIGTFAWSAQAVLGRAFFALQETRVPLSITKWMALLLIGFLFVSSKVFEWHFGALALAMSLVGTLNMGLLLLALSRRLEGLDVPGILRGAARILVVAVVSAIAAYCTARLIAPYFSLSRLHGLLQTLIAGGVGVGVYGVASVALRVPELRSIRALFKRTPA